MKEDTAPVFPNSRDQRHRVRSNLEVPKSKTTGKTKAGAGESKAIGERAQTPTKMSIITSYQPGGKPLVPENYILSPDQICGSPHSTSRQIQKEITSVLHDETTSVSYALESRTHTNQQEANYDFIFNSIQQAEVLEQRDKKVFDIINAHQNVSVRHSNFLSCNRATKTGDATSPRGLSMMQDPKAYSTSPFSKAVKARNLSKSQKNLLDIVKHLDMQKRGAPKDKPASTMATMVDKNKFNVTLEVPSMADVQVLPRPPTMQGYRALSTLRVATADAISGGSRAPGPVR